jgi:4-hydroxy-2-oxoheptanedioate aldolase
MLECLVRAGEVESARVRRVSAVRRQEPPLTTNDVKQALTEGQSVIGCFVQYPSPVTVEICGHSGFDFVMIDCEHGPMGNESAYTMILAAERSGTVPLVRVPMNHPQVILRYLDVGAAGIMVPQINSVEEAQAVVQAVKYHPEGRRGVAGTRAQSWSITQPLSEYVKTANRETLVMVQIENIRAVDALSDIMQVPGVDVLYVGPNDLAQSMGYPGRPDHPDVQKVIDQICEVARDSHVALGTVANDADTINHELSRGFRMVGANSASLLAAASRQVLDGIRR